MKSEQMGSKKNRWRISFHWSPSPTRKPPPKEFTCPISGSLMSDPVIVSSGQTFERNCVEACKRLAFKPILSDGATPNFSTVIPNLALKSAVLNWCGTHFVDPPKPMDTQLAVKLARSLMACQNQQPEKKRSHADTELLDRTSHFSSSSEESVAAATFGSTTSLPLTIRPSCFSSPWSSYSETQNPNSIEEDDFVAKLKSSQMFDQEEALLSLRNMTRTREETRVWLCTPRLLLALRSLITSRYATLQVNAMAALVNLSLKNQNKVMIVRSGIVPPVIEVLKGGFPEAQEHAAGALFSLALDDQNKTAIGVLGALPPLLHLLQSDSTGARYDSALALYHLSLVQSNRTKMVKLGAVQTLLGMLKSGYMMSQVLLILCNLAVCVEGRAAMLDGSALECFVGLLKKDRFADESTRDTCVAALHRLSLGGLRFKGLAKEAGAEEVLRRVEGAGSGRCKEKARQILETLKGRDEDEEEVDWEELLNSGESQTF